MSSGFYLSLSDLMLIDDFPRVFSLDDKKMLESFLYTNGLDTSKPYDQELVTHRNLQNKIVNCVRFIGFERCDLPWLKGGAASLDAWIASTGDASFRDELRGMSRERNKSVETIEYDSKNYAKE